MNSKKFNLSFDDKRFVEISQNWGGHPRILRSTDYSMLTNGNYHFARKFNPQEDTEILDMLDQIIFPEGCN